MTVRDEGKQVSQIEKLAENGTKPAEDEMGQKKQLRESEKEATCDSQGVLISRKSQGAVVAGSLHCLSDGAARLRLRLGGAASLSLKPLWTWRL